MSDLLICPSKISIFKNKELLLFIRAPCGLPNAENEYEVYFDFGCKLCFQKFRSLLLWKVHFRGKYPLTCTDR